MRLLINIFFLFFGIMMNTSSSSQTNADNTVSNNKEITAFAIAGQAAIITGHEIVWHTLGNPAGPYVATFETTGVKVTVNGVNQISGVSKNLFSQPLIYVVTAADGSTSNYTVTTKFSPPARKPGENTVY